MERIKTLENITTKFNTADEAVDPLVVQKMGEALDTSGFLNLMQFTCPVINPAAFVTEQPEAYLLASPRGNNFEKSLPRLKKLIQAFMQAGIQSQLDIVIGDTDEEDYIFPVVKSTDLNPALVEQNKERYRQTFSERVKIELYETGIRYIGLDIWRVSEITGSYPAVIPSPSSSEINESAEMEIPVIQDIFNYYYQGVFKVDIGALREIARLKVISYATQGFVLAREFPLSVLLQNEYPPLLRTRMLNILNKDSGTTLPAFYLYKFGRND